MKVKINGFEVEGTPEEIAAVLKLMDGHEEKITYIPYYPYSPYCPSYPTYPTWTICDSRGVDSAGNKYEAK